MALGRFTLESEACRVLDASVPDLGYDVVEPLLGAGYSPMDTGALGHHGHSAQ